MKKLNPIFATPGRLAAFKTALERVQPYATKADTTGALNAFNEKVNALQTSPEYKQALFEMQEAGERGDEVALKAAKAKYEALRKPLWDEAQRLYGTSTPDQLNQAAQNQTGQTPLNYTTIPGTDSFTAPSNAYLQNLPTPNKIVGRQ